jgi:hypothetical protein
MAAGTLRWVTVQANVIYRGDTPVILQVSPPLKNVAFIGNFWDPDPDNHDCPPTGVVVGGNAHVCRGKDSNRRLPRYLPAQTSSPQRGLQRAWCRTVGLETFGGLEAFVPESL